MKQPDKIGFAGNLKDFEFAASKDCHFQLNVDGKTIVDEIYTPEYGHVNIRMKEVVEKCLTVSVPPFSEFLFVQSDAVKTFTARINDSTYTFTAIAGGVFGVDDMRTFLKQNFLTWQPQEKRVLPRQPEFLTYYCEGDAGVMIRAYGEGFDERDCLWIELPSGLVTMNLCFDLISQKFPNRPDYYDVWIEDRNSPERYTYIQRYVPIAEPDNAQIYVFENSLGGIDTLLCSGVLTEKINTTGNLVKQYESVYDIDIDFSLCYTQHTGYLHNSLEGAWLRDFFLSRQRYHLAETLRRIYMEDQENEFTPDDLNSFDFEFYYCDQNRFQKISRNRDSLPELLEVANGDQLFFLTPRLSEYPVAKYTDELLLPVQHPYTGIWHHLPVSAIKSIYELNDASYDIKGIAAFNPEHFIVRDGVVQLNLGTINLDTYFYEKDGELHCKMNFVGDLDVCAFGGNSGSGGGGVDLVDDLTSTRTDAALTANMGRYLKSLIDGKASSWETITGKPSTFTPSEHTHPYLPLTGGTLTGSLTATTVIANGYLQSISNSQKVQIGSGNSDYCHFSTSAPKHWFNKPVYVAGDVYGGTSYNRRLAYVDELTNIVLYGEVGIDATGLDQNKWYPVSIYVGDLHKQTEIRVIVALNGNKPSWATHNSGFSCRFIEVVNGSGWGTTHVNRRILCNDYNFAPGNPVGGVTQNTQGSFEIIYVRGGGYYYFHVSTGATPTLHSSGYNWSSGSYSYSAPVRDSALNDNWQWSGSTDIINRANKLRYARTLWGQSFDGSGNVSGALSGVTTITASGTILTETGFIRQGYSGNSWFNGHGALNVAIVNNSSQTPLIVAYRSGQSISVTGANRLFSLELLNTGTLMYWAFGGSRKFEFSSAGNFLATGEITAYSASDIRLKTNIYPLDGLACIDKLRPVEFDWTSEARKLSGDNRQHGRGLIAQEVKNVLPDAVGNIYNSEYLGIQYEKFIPILIAAVRQLSVEVKRLKKEA